MSKQVIIMGKVKLLPQRLRWFDPWVRKIPWRGNGNPLQYSFLGNPQTMGVTKECDMT